MIDSNEVKYPCPSCDCPDQMRISQSGFSGDLRWSESVNCIQCGLTTEADGLGFPSEEIREKMLSVNGRWKVFLDEVKSSSAASRVIMKLLAAQPKKALEILRNSVDGVYVGTRVEALWFAEKFKEVGESPRVFHVV